MTTRMRYSAELRERAVPILFEHQGEHESQCAAIRSIAEMIGCARETLRRRGGNTKLPFYMINKQMDLKAE